MHRPLLIPAICLLLFASCNVSTDASVETSSVPLADPYILYHDGVYYAYGTNPDNKIGIYTSRNLHSWRVASEAMPTDAMWGENLFWAPEVYYIKEKGRFLMYYTSDDRICAAWSDSPLGPFSQSELVPMLDEKCVDNTLFVDDDGQAYVFFNRFDNGMTIYGAELEKDLTTIRLSTMKLLLTVSQKWEEIWPKVNEGAYVVKHDGHYHMFYSGNSYLSHSYGIGFATATSPLGAWSKYDLNPILQKPAGLVGAGHGTVFKDRHNRTKMVFHAHQSCTEVRPRVMYTADVDFIKGRSESINISHIRPTQLKR